jgi:hypothetical protein
MADCELCTFASAWAGTRRIPISTIGSKIGNTAADGGQHLKDLRMTHFSEQERQPRIPVRLGRKMSMRCEGPYSDADLGGG